MRHSLLSFRGNWLCGKSPVSGSGGSRGLFFKLRWILQAFVQPKERCPIFAVRRNLRIASLKRETGLRVERTGDVGNKVGRDTQVRTTQSQRYEYEQQRVSQLSKLGREPRAVSIYYEHRTL